jgi:hypothetical protein
MKKISVLTVVASLLIGGTAAAGAWSKKGTINVVRLPGSGDSIRIDFSEDIVQPDEDNPCGGAEYYIRELDETAGSSRFVSAVLAAFLAGKQVSFWIKNCTTNAHWGSTRPQPADIYIY